MDLALSLQLPIMLGGQATLELPYGFLVQGELGVLPQLSVNAIDSGLSGAGVYDMQRPSSFKSIRRCTTCMSRWDGAG